MISSPTGHVRRNRAWGALRGLLTLEALGLGALVVFTILSALAEDGDVAQEVSIVLMSASAFAWVAITAVGSIRTRASWVRSSSLTVHVLMFAAGTGCLQLGIGEWWLGFGIVALALVGFVAAILVRPEVSSEFEAEGELGNE